MGRKKSASGGGEAVATGTETAKGAELLALLKARAPAEDLAAYRAEVVAASAELAGAALKRHRRGDSVISVENDPAIERQGRPVTVITVINDNMPFLFDSVIGEIADTAGEPLLVLHPVILVRHDRRGVAELIGDAAAARADADVDRVSLIHVHVALLSDEERSALAARLAHILAQVRAAVADWKPMLARLDQAIADFRYLPVPLDGEAVAEAIAFLEWLRDNNFTFLGIREFRYRGGEEKGRLERTDRKGLGILADPNVLVLRRGTETVTTTPEIRAFLHGPEPLIVTKANAKSVVHRRIYLDYVGIKTFDRKGGLSGELRIVGLFTSSAYTRSVTRIPYLRSKVAAVIAKSGFDPADHSGKALINVLESYPRDELFQIGVPTLRKHAQAILALGERPRVRALFRIDQFDRFVSVIVFVPRDRYDSIARERIGAFLVRAFDGRLSAYYPAFPEGSLARVHFIIGRSGGKTPKVESATLEAAIRDIVRTWEDALREAVTDLGADAAHAACAARFPVSYRNSFSAATALRDAANVLGVSANAPIAIDFYHQQHEAPAHAGLKIYHHAAPLALSERVPLLENMGFRVISERTFEIDREDNSGAAGRVFLHDMELESADGAPIDLADGGALFEEVFLSVWNGESDNDPYNALAHTAGLGASRIRILRAYGRYLQQAGIPQSQDFIAAVLNRYPRIARDLFVMFSARFDPEAIPGKPGTGFPGIAEEQEFGGDAGYDAAEAVEKALEDVPSLDDDTILRRYLNLIGATLRTNHYAAPDEKGLSLALKLDSQAVEGLPAPRPWREIFVYGPQVEGVHLRFGAVARGGLRWSDRAQDYRTEVLGLVKAQQVKNAVIVPVGAKGGFYPKRLPAGGSREEIFEAGRAAYINFVASMLSMTDNLDGERVVPPKDIIRHDGDDPYFVVAADKGTATFSDTANAISAEQGFWLDDAFASGGSAGYDHKKMGITARGAWEAVKRHFREMDRDIQTEPFTVAGVGDMSGDVFGNGMLLSGETRLVAAFDHRDIFIDPDPDAARSFAERKRMFELPRSSWQDYDREVLSKGGMIVSRAQKSVELTREAASLLGLSGKTATPIEIMKAILKAPVDLLWFGGIGTYVRASAETALEVGDRANDAIRVAAGEVGAKVVGEGANLGMTQRARIEYGLAGGRCNSDAIDNSAGVNSSDVEVNIKIALVGAMRKGRLKRPARDRLLAQMTGEVASLVLANNYKQTLSISLTERRGMADLVHQARLMNALGARGLLDREVEYLPGPQELAEREARGEPLTRAEIGVLLAYAKLTLYDDLLESPVPDDPHFDADLIGYFPVRMAKTYAAEIRSHRLRREIVATEIANDLVNRSGPATVNRLQELTGRQAHEVAAAFAVVRDGFGVPALSAEIDALDNRVGGAAQLFLYSQLGRLIHSASAWLLKNGPAEIAVGAEVAALAAARAELEPALPSLLPPFMAERLAEREQEFAEAGAPPELAARLAFLRVSELVPDIALTAAQAGAKLRQGAEAFFAVSHALRIGRVEEAARSVQTTDYYDGLALSRALDTIGAARRGLAVSALKASPGSGDPVAAWLEAGGERVERARERLQALTESGEITVSRLTVAAGVMTDLMA